MAWIRGMVKMKINRWIQMYFEARRVQDNSWLGLFLAWTVESKEFIFMQARTLGGGPDT